MNCFIMKNPFRFFFFFFFAFAMQTGGGRKVASDLSHFPPSVGAWVFCCFFFFFCSKSPLHARIHLWLVAVIIAPSSLSLISLFPHARTKRLRPMDSGGHTGRVFSAGDRPTTLCCLLFCTQTPSSNMSEHIESGGGGERRKDKRVRSPNFRRFGEMF